MHKLNELRLLSGLQVDASLERKQVNENHTQINEGRKTPLRRSELVKKDQKSLSSRVAGLSSAIKHIQNAVKALDKIPSTDFGGDVQHAIAELEDVLEGDNGITGLIHLLDQFDNDHISQVKSDKKAAKIAAEEEEACDFNSSMVLDESEMLGEDWYDIKVKHRDTAGFKIKADSRDEAEEKANARLSNMRGGKGLIISIKLNTDNATSDESRFAKKLDALDQKEKDALVKRVDQKSRAGGSLTPLEDYIIKSSNYKASATKTEEKSEKKDEAKKVDESISKGTYEINDRVRTSMGNGTIVSAAEPNASFFKDNPSNYGSDDFYNVKLDKDDELAKKLKVAGETHKFGSFDFKGHVKESMHYYVDNEYTNYEDDDDKPINVTDGSANDEQVWDGRSNGTDESPSQLATKQDDAEEKMSIPAGIKNQLKAEIDQARKEAKLLDTSNKDAANFYNDLATAFEELHDKLASGTVYDFKQAQTFAQTFMGPMLHKLPNDVWKFLTNGGQARSLKSYMQEVK